MMMHIDMSDADVRQRIKEHTLRFGGNSKLKIYGTLKCSSGKRMKRNNRVFFISEQEAVEMGYRPCGHCMRSEYQKWRARHA